jgi:preprotein translocase subunit SecA
MKEGEEISHPWVTKSIARAQKKVEGYHFEIRKNLLEYDEVMNEQRKLVYSERQRVIEGGELYGMIRGMMEKVVRGKVEHFLTAPEGDLVAAAGSSEEEGDAPEVSLDRVASLQAWLRGAYGFEVKDLALDPDLRPKDQIEDFRKRILATYDEKYAEKTAELGQESMYRVERFILLLKIDEKWKDHLYAMDHLRHGIGLRGYGQIDPKIAYKQEGYQMFSMLIENLRTEVTELIFRVRVRKEDESKLGTNLDRAQYRKDDPGAQAQAQAEKNAQAGQQSTEPIKPIRNVAPKVGRNDPCPCGSGKKYKKCCGIGKGAA